jgi:hypothetical protein
MARFVIVATALLEIVHLTSAQLSLEPSSTPDQNVRLLRWLDSADVNAEFQRHVVRQHDTRFIATYGYATNIPGADDKRDAALIRRHGLRYIKGTSDAITSPEHERLVDKAEAYAERYNSMLLHYLHSPKKT